MPEQSNKSEEHADPTESRKIGDLLNLMNRIVGIIEGHTDLLTTLMKGTDARFESFERVLNEMSESVGDLSKQFKDDYVELAEDLNRQFNEVNENIDSVQVMIRKLSPAPNYRDAESNQPPSKVKH